MELIINIKLCSPFYGYKNPRFSEKTDKSCLILRNFIMADDSQIKILYFSKDNRCN